MKIFKREQRSLFGEILDWMLIPLLLVWPVSLGLTWLVAQGIAAKPFDRALEYNVQALAQLIVVNQRRVQLNLPQPAREILRADDADVIYFQALGPKNEWLAGERDFPPPPFDERAQGTDVRLRDDTMRGQDVRVAYTWVRLDLPSTLQGLPSMALVQVAETKEKRSVLATEIIKGVMLPQFVMLPLAVLLVWLALARGIKPLDQLEGRIRARQADDLSPLDDRTVPLEVAPLVKSINDLLKRLKGTIATQKRFLADAAHQLKTPLAGLRMQADLAQREGADAAELKLSLQQIGRASIRATRTVNQLLSLARADSGGTQFAPQPCDLARITLETVQDAALRALEKHLDFGYDGAALGAPGATLMGNPTLLQELVRNLIDNAIHYTPSTPSHPGIVTARVLADVATHTLLLEIEDSGPGIAPSERALVFEPFYRTLGTEADGTGLGLAIVQEIAKLHGAVVEIEDAQAGKVPPGARVRVRFGDAILASSCILLHPLAAPCPTS